ncbi:uncharacterized protein LOC111121031 isoform X1 [Crassostrea virginica]
MTVLCYIRRKILVVLGVFTSLGLITGTVTPWWVVLVSPDSRLVNGLWYSLSCDVSSGLSLCRSLLAASDSTIGGVRLEYALLMLFGTLVCMLATVFLILYTPREDTIRSTLTGCLTVALFTISALLTWIAVGKACADNVRLGRDHDLDGPWSLVVSAVAGTMPIFLAVVISFRIHNNVTNIQKERRQKKKTRQFFEQRSCHSSTMMLGNTGTLQSSSLHSSVHSLDISFSNHQEVNSLNSLTMEFKEDISKISKSQIFLDNTSPVFQTDTIPYKFPNNPPY